ncbi:glucans biosynthesis glucosyltransferase MdoH [Aliiglaciecola lipolytica]|nr:glucans biosynthesis glucosyltransferase MdoH [Aliiglaciecola lipolytica]
MKSNNHQEGVHMSTSTNEHFIKASAKTARKYSYAFLVLATAIVGGWAMTDIFSVDGFTAIEIVLLFLFTLTFVWISAAFWSAIIGFTLLMLRRDPVTLKQALRKNQAGSLDPNQRQAIIMPVYNEDTNRIMSGFEACIKEIEKSGSLQYFDFYMLSDTQQKPLIEAELVAWNKLTARMGNEVASHMFYRRREKNVNRKVGNVADFCERWGANYQSMIVLDADSLMTAESMLTLVKTLQSNPKAGLIQTVPIPIRQNTLFGRFLQFASSLYCPTLAAGQAFWQTDTANYWGHNAIIRIDAFMASCGLPHLPGDVPFGGEILSHDFVEAALLRRAGWHVYLLADLEGSYEEVPSNIIDYATRDRRWVQGNLQHLGLLRTEGLQNISKLHFVLGAFAYVSSLVWFVLLLLSTIDATVRAASDDVFFTAPHQLFPAWPVDKSDSIFALLFATALLLIGPKFLSLIHALVYRRYEFGGALTLVISTLIEIVVAIVIAPLMMAYHAYFVLNALAGKNVSWNAQSREGRTVPWSEAIKRTWAATTLAILWGALTWYLTPLLFWWLAPVLLGLILGAPIIHYSSSLKLGIMSRKYGVFICPCEVIEQPVTKSLRLSLSNLDKQSRYNKTVPELPPERWTSMPIQELRPTTKAGLKHGQSITNE